MVSRCHEAPSPPSPSIEGGRFKQRSPCMASSVIGSSKVGAAGQPPMKGRPLRALKLPLGDRHSFSGIAPLS